MWAFWGHKPPSAITVRYLNSPERDLELLRCPNVVSCTDLPSRGEHGERQKERENNFVALEEAALDVGVDLVRHVLDDVVNALGRHRCSL